jgi:S-adenosyl-l-methionine hydroxide adenosyltransferase
VLLHIIADYGAGDLAFAEVIQRFQAHLYGCDFERTPVPAFSTLAAGFCVAQLGLNEAPPGMVMYQNVAPRGDEAKARKANAGERLAYARLKSGVRVIGVNSEFSFSFVKHASEELRWVDVKAEGSQFRSRDIFPRAAAQIIQGDLSLLGRQIRASEIPEIPKSRIAYIDGYGNLKTTIRAGEQKARVGAELKVKIGQREKIAILADASFDVPSGQMAFAPGSSGWKIGASEVRWMELFLRGGNAWQEFGEPEAGARIEIG